MQAFTNYTAKVIPLRRSDIDTDQIIPAKFLTSVSREGYGQNLFRGLRDSDPNFPLDRPEFSGAGILVVDSNFGCGSSREHAVWAIVGAGIRVVIAKSFADIFYSNSSKNGLLLVTLAPKIVDSILEAAQSADYEVSIDLERQVVQLPDGEEHHFEYDAFRKYCLLNGLDDIDYIRSKESEIKAFRESHSKNRFFTTEGVAS